MTIMDNKICNITPYFTSILWFSLFLGIQTQ